MKALKADLAIALLGCGAMLTGQTPPADPLKSIAERYVNLGNDLVRDFVTKRAGRNATDAKRWQEFVGLLSSPRLPSGLK
jgi:hypothetical protein